MSVGGGAPSLPERIEPGMLHTSPRLRRLVPLLQPLPSALGEALLAAIAMADGLIRVSRYRRARAWAAAQPRRAGRPPWRLALAVLANHGRFCGEEALLGVSSPARRHPVVVVEGMEHLEAAQTGAILLGFHLGPPRTWFHLRSLGYPVRLAGRLGASIHDPRWAVALEARDAVRLSDAAAADRLTGLYQIREILRSGGLVFLTADGPFGREAFPIDLPGGPLVVRTGWLALRRATQAPTLPVLAHRDGKRHVIVVSPPLPPPDPDPRQELAACRTALTAVVSAYVNRFPEQCRYLALPRPKFVTRIGERGTRQHGS